MALTVAELNTRLTADTRNLQAGLKRAEADVKGFGSSGTAAMGSFKGAIAAVAASAAFKQIADVFGSAIKGASDLAEAANATGVAFGQATPQVVAWSQSLSAAFGATRTEALTAASQFQMVTREAGLTGEQITDLAERAFDLGSQWNVSAAEVSRAIKSGLVGEMEPLRRFGIILNQNKLEAEALALGLKGPTEEMSAGAKQAAAYSLIMQGSVLAQGDAANTAGAAAGQMRQLRVQSDELKNELGSALLPAFVRIAGFLNDEMIPAFHTAIDVFGDLVGAITSAAQGPLRLLANVLDPVGLDSWSESLRGAADDMSGFRDNAFSGSERIKGLTDTLVEENAAGGAAAVANKNLSDSIDKVGDSAREAEEHLVKLKDAQFAVRDATFSLADAHRDAAEAQDELNLLLASGGIDAEKLAQAQEGVTEAQERLNRVLADAGERILQDVERATNDLTKANEKLADQTQDVVDAEAKLSKLKAQKQARDEAVKNAKAQLAAADTVTERIIAQEALDAALGMEIVTDKELAAAQSNVTTEQGKLKTATDAVKTASDGLTEAQRQQPAQFDSVKDATRRLEDAQRDLNTAQQQSPTFAKDVADAQRAVETANYSVEKATWAAEKAQRAYNAALNDQPRNVTTTVTRNEVVNSSQVLSQSAMSGAVQWVSPNFVGPLTANMARLPKMGPYSPDQAAAARMLGLPVLHQGGIVPGPRGADVPIMAQAGERVLSADQAGMGGGGVTVIVEGSVITDRDLGRVVADAIRNNGLYGIN